MEILNRTQIYRNYRSKSCTGENLEKGLGYELTTLKDMKQFILGDKLGQGSFGTVRLATHLLTGERVAIKILERARIKEKIDKTRIDREISILKRLIHPYIIRIYSVIETHSSLNIVQEYANGKDFLDYLVEKKKLDEQEACKYFQQIISAIEYLHKQGISHRDLKPENMILTKSNELKLIDFGLSNTYTQGELLSTACGSPCYAAPEMLEGKRYSGALIDIWASGIILYVMLVGQLPFDDSCLGDLYKKIKSGKYKVPKGISKDAKDLIKNILEVNPRKRFKISQIKAHPWFNIVDPKENVCQGINLKNVIYPIDEDIIARMALCGYNKQEVRKHLYSNELGNSSITYNLMLRQKIKKGEQSVSDLKSELFKEFISNQNNKMIFYNNRIKEVILKRASSKGDLIDEPNEAITIEVTKRETNTTYNTPRENSKTNIFQSKRISAKVSPSHRKNNLNCNSSYSEKETHSAITKKSNQPKKFSTSKTLISTLAQKIKNEQGSTLSTTENTPTLMMGIKKQKPKTIKLIKNILLNHQQNNKNSIDIVTSRDKESIYNSLYTSREMSRAKTMGYKSHSLDEKGISELGKINEYTSRINEMKKLVPKKKNYKKYVNKTVNNSFEDNETAKAAIVKNNNIKAKKSILSSNNVPKLNLNKLSDSIQRTKRNKNKSADKERTLSSVGTTHRGYYTTQKNSPKRRFPKGRTENNIEISSFTKREKRSSLPKTHNTLLNYINKTTVSSPRQLRPIKKFEDKTEQPNPFDLSSIVFKSIKTVQSEISQILKDQKIKSKNDKYNSNKIVCEKNFSEIKFEILLMSLEHCESYSIVKMKFISGNKTKFSVIIKNIYSKLCL